MPRLVAVSKKQPVEKVTWAYRQGLRHFGENYVSTYTQAYTRAHIPNLANYGFVFM